LRQPVIAEQSQFMIRQNENPARVWRPKGTLPRRGLRTLIGDILQEEGRVRQGILDPLAYTDLTAE
jgi:hypothetical protein